MAAESAVPHVDYFTNPCYQLYRNYLVSQREYRGHCVSIW